MEEGVDSDILSSNAFVAKIWNARLHGCKPIDAVTQRIFQKSLHVHQILCHHLTDSSSKSIAHQKFNCNFCNIFASTMANVVHTVLIENCTVGNAVPHCSSQVLLAKIFWVCVVCSSCQACCINSASPTSVSICCEY